MKKGNFLSVLAIFLSLVAIIMCSVSCLTKEKVIAKTLYNNPEMVVESLQRYEVVSREKQFAALETVIAENAKELNNNPESPFYGPETAKANLVLFFDYSCGYCHKLYPVLKDVSEKNPSVKFVFKPLSFLGPISDYAARAVLAANEQGKFKELNNALFEFKEQLTEAKIDELAAKAGLDMDKFKEALTSEKVNSNLEANSSLANSVQIAGVPTMVLGGKVLQTFDAVEIQKAIDAVK